MAPRLILPALVLLSAILITGVTCTPLDDYVNAVDPHYNYTVLDYKFKGAGYTLYLINMTSQKWLTEAEVENPIWFHYMEIAVPDNWVRLDAGFLYIAQGHNDGAYIPDPTNKFTSFITLMAASTGTITGVIHQVPNQPTVFLNDPSRKRRSEDDVIAWTWRTFIQNPSNPEWLLRLPMTKASVRAMDTIASFAQSLITQANINKFMVIGESKRGWTTWTTAAVDKRVIGIAPVVMDLLNLVKNLHHHYRSLGGWTFAFESYYQVNITAHIDDPQIQKMADIVDPFAYKDRLTIPKYIVTTSGDEFFLPDDSYYYFSEMVGDKYLRVIPNADHSLKLHRESLFFGIRSFYLSVLYPIKRPKLSWVRENNQTGGSLTFTTDTKPDTIVVYRALTTDGIRRDFRLFILDPNDPGKVQPHPVIWLKDDVEQVSENVYRASYKNPEVGWMGFYIQATFRLPLTEYEFEFTSEVQIIPNTLPFPDCHGAACRGKLV